MFRLVLWWRVLVVALRSRSNQQFYDRIAPIYDRVFEEHRVHADNMTDVLVERFRGHERTTRVLDLGCGTGMLTRRLVDHGFDVLGLDISFESLRMLRRHDTKIATINSVAAPLPLVDKSCQAVVALGAWRHFPEPHRVMKEVVRVLDKSGVLIIGYFPPALGGVIHQGTGVLSRWLASLYRWLIGKRGYVDQADLALEKQTLALTGDFFEQVITVDSGKRWRLIVGWEPMPSAQGSK